MEKMRRKEIMDRITKGIAECEAYIKKVEEHANIKNAKEQIVFFRGLQKLMETGKW